MKLEKFVFHAPEGNNEDARKIVEAILEKHDYSPRSVQINLNEYRVHEGK